MSDARLGREGLLNAAHEMRLSTDGVAAHVDDRPAGVVAADLVAVPPAVLAAVVRDLLPGRRRFVGRGAQELDEAAERLVLDVVPNGQNGQNENGEYERHDRDGQHLPSPKNRGFKYQYSA